MKGVQMPRCLICYSDTIKSAQLDLVSQEVTLTEKNNVDNNQCVLSKHLNVIFILKTVFELPSSDLSEYLRSCPSVEDWIFICKECEQQINKCKLIFSEILKVTKKLQNTKQSIAEVVKSSYRSNASLNESESTNVLDIAQKCRHFINQHNYKKMSNPFNEGDFKAKQLVVGQGINPSLSSSSQFCSSTSSINTPDIIVKEEIEELNIYDGNQCEGSDSGDRETCKDTGDEDWVPAFLEPEETVQSSETSESVNETSPQNTTNKKKKVGEPKSRTKKSQTTGVGLKKKSKCTVCGKVLCNDYRLRLHMTYHDKKPKYKCQHCEKEFYRPDHRKRHEKIHSETKEYACDVCHRKFRRKDKLRDHKRKVHKISPGSQGYSDNDQAAASLTVHEDTCSQCGKRFYTKEAMLSHTDQHHHRNDKDFTCEHCGSVFATRTKLNSHKSDTLRCKLLYQNESEATIVCDQCGKKFGNKHNLAVHIKRVHMEKEYNFACKHCEKKFTRRSVWQIHLFRIHKIDNVEVKSYKCDVEGCGKVFFRKGVLDDHLSQHKREPKYTCWECGKQFYFSEKFRQHMTGVHGPKEKVNCDICGMECVSKLHLTRHKSRFHKKVKTLLGNNTKELQQPLKTDEVGD